jgi:hypothetical protein
MVKVIEACIRQRKLRRNGCVLLAVHVQTLSPDTVSMNDGRGKDCIIDVRVSDTDAKSNLNKDLAKVLEAHEKENKRKYLKSCLQQRRHFTPFVVSTDGLIGKVAKTLLKKLSSLLAEKCIAIVRATPLLERLSYSYQLDEQSSSPVLRQGRTRSLPTLFLDFKIRLN